MTSNEMLEYMDSLVTPNIRFTDIPEIERLHPNQDICLMMAWYNCMLACGNFTLFPEENDEIILGHVDELSPDTTEEQLLYMKRCGCGVHKEQGYFYFYT